jgi:hypothetical protein
MKRQFKIVFYTQKHDYVFLTPRKLGGRDTIKKE